jgi:hypothetical protein
VIKFVLSASSYSWQFIPVGGGPVKDSGSANCH